MVKQTNHYDVEHAWKLLWRGYIICEPRSIEMLHRYLLGCCDRLTHVKRALIEPYRAFRRADRCVRGSMKTKIYKKILLTLASLWPAEICDCQDRLNVERDDSLIISEVPIAPQYLIRELKRETATILCARLLRPIDPREKGPDRTIPGGGSWDRSK